jgi:ATP-dependent Zn protease
MKVLLAGRVSEQITFGRITTGASDDLKRVTDIARSMVYEYGMGTTIRSHQVPSDDYTVSEALRTTRDEEVQEIAEEAYRGAHRVLTDHRDLLDEIAERLLANEVIEHEEIHVILERWRTATKTEPPPLPPTGPEPSAAPVAEALASKPPPEQ